MTALRIGDEPLTPEAVVAAARGGTIDVELTAAARERIARVARRRRGRRRARAPVYGRTTGVGANRHDPVAGGRPARPQRRAAAQPRRRRR